MTQGGCKLPPLETPKALQDIKTDLVQLFLTNMASDEVQSPHCPQLLYLYFCTGRYQLPPKPCLSISPLFVAQKRRQHQVRPWRHAYSPKELQGKDS